MKTAALLILLSCPLLAADYDVRKFGAVGDGKALDTAAIQKAIDAAAAAGGGTVDFPAGTYLSFSLRLKSHVGLHLDHGAVLLAATPGKHGGKYDAPEPNEWDMYQDFGHSHWQNSLIWGIGLENISITGPGLIQGEGLTRRGPGPRRKEAPGDTPTTLKDAADASKAVDPEGKGTQGDEFESMVGEGNKAIALKLCRNVTLRDFSLLNGGHFALLATGVDHLTLDNLKVDSNRDGFDIDCCRHVRISNCSVNTANDDAIVLKSSFGLGFARATENVTMVNCQVSGFDPGTFLDGSFGRTQELAPDRDRVTGRIKFGTESNGGFRNITINNCVFERCRGIALETVDGGLLEDVNISNITMRDITSAPIFLRIGARMRGPEGVALGKIRRIRLDNISVYNADAQYASIIAGIPGSEIEDVSLSNIRIHAAGGGTKEQAALVLPENEKAYPEPSMFGITPCYGFFIRHAKGVRMNHVEVSFLKDDARPAFVVEKSSDLSFDGVNAQRSDDVPVLVLKDVEKLKLRNCGGIDDQGHGMNFPVSTEISANISPDADLTPPTAVLPGATADPHIAVFGDTYYIYPTTDGSEGWMATSFRAWSSKDLKTWKDEGVILDLPRDLKWAEVRAWAPAIATANGKYYYYYSAGQSVGVAVADKPAGPFKDPLGKPLVEKGQYKGVQSIDPMVFIDEDGSAYLYFGQGRCKAVKLNEDMISFDPAKVADLTPPGYNEGSFVFKRKGMYYLSWSEFDTRDPRYSVAYATSKSPLGPFKKAEVNPILKQKGAVKGAGHHSIVQIPGRDEWVIAYHRFRIPGGNGYNRETCLSPLRFDADGAILPVDVFEPVTPKLLRAP